MDIDEIKKAYRIPSAWRDLRLSGEPGKCVKSPFRETDNHPSFSVYGDGMKFKDHATGDSGSVVDFVSIALDADVRAALAWIKRRLAFDSPQPEPGGKIALKVSSRVTLRKGSPDEITRLCALRGFTPGGCILAGERGVLRFAEFARQAAWVITDESKRLAEFRRMDGLPWDAFKNLPERKCHCRGSGKDIPVGLQSAAGFDHFLLVEGSPDAVAAHCFLAASARGGEVGVLAMLGGGNHLSLDAAKELSGKRVRLVPHADEPGQRASVAWAEVLRTAGAHVDAYSLADVFEEIAPPRMWKDLADMCRLLVAAGNPDDLDRWGLLP